MNDFMMNQPPLQRSGQKISISIPDGYEIAIMNGKIVIACPEQPPIILEVKADSLEIKTIID